MFASTSSLRSALLRTPATRHVQVAGRISFHASALRAEAELGLEKQLRNGLKAAMKGKDKAAVTCLKAILADITNVAKSGPDPSAPATESAVLSAVRKGIDKRREAANLYAPSGPSPHAEQHSALSSEVSLLSSFLPAAPSAADVQKLIDETLASLSDEVRSGKGAMGAAMKAVLERLGAAAGAVDRKEVGRLVGEGLKKVSQ